MSFGGHPMLPRISFPFQPWEREQDHEKEIAQCIEKIQTKNCVNLSHLDAVIPFFLAVEKAGLHEKFVFTRYSLDPRNITAFDKSIDLSCCPMERIQFPINVEKMREEIAGWGREVAFKWKRSAKILRANCKSLEEDLLYM